MVGSGLEYRLLLGLGEVGTAPSGFQRFEPGLPSPAAVRRLRVWGCGFFFPFFSTPELFFLKEEELLVLQSPGVELGSV